MEARVMDSGPTRPNTLSTSLCAPLPIVDSIWAKELSQLSILFVINVLNDNNTSFKQGEPNVSSLCNVVYLHMQWYGLCRVPLELSPAVWHLQVR